jgi:serine/threonine protein kinase
MQMTSIIKALHSDNKIIHGDLHQSNWIIEDETQEMKLVDFGSAVMLTESEFVAVTEEMTFTNSHAAPEQAEEGQVYSYASDIWQLGCTFEAMVDVANSDGFSMSTAVTENGF